MENNKACRKCQIRNKWVPLLTVNCDCKYNLCSHTPRIHWSRTGCRNCNILHVKDLKVFLSISSPLLLIISAHLTFWWQNWRKIPPLKTTLRLIYHLPQNRMFSCRKGKHKSYVLSSTVLSFQKTHFLDRLPLHRERRLKDFFHHKSSKFKQTTKPQIQPPSGSTLGKGTVFPVLSWSLPLALPWQQASKEPWMRDISVTLFWPRNVRSAPHCRRLWQAKSIPTNSIMQAASPDYCLRPPIFCVRSTLHMQRQEHSIFLSRRVYNMNPSLPGLLSLSVKMLWT